MVRVFRVSTTAISRNNSPSGINLFREAVPHRAQPPDSISLIRLIRLIVCAIIKQKWLASQRAILRFAIIELLAQLITFPHITVSQFQLFL